MTPTKLKQAASIVDARVNGSGVSEAEVSTQGNRNIIVEIPGKNASNLVDAVKRTAQLRFRLVAGQPQPGTPAATPVGLALDEGRPPSRPVASARRLEDARSANQATPKPTRRRPSPTPRPTPTPAAPSASAPAPQQSQPQVSAEGCAGRPAARVVAGPGRRVAHEVRRVHLPGARDDEAAPSPTTPDEPLITCDDKGQKFLLSAALIEGTELKSASYGIPQNGVGWAVNLAFKSTARKVFGDTTTALNKNNGTFAIVLDGKVISYAGVNEPILDGNAQITGDFKEAEARSLANSLKYGALPLKFDDHDRDDRPLAGRQPALGGHLRRHRRPADRDALLPALLPRPRAGGGRLADRRGADHLRLVLVLGQGRRLHPHPARHRRSDRRGRHHRGLVHRLLRTNT